MPTTRIALAGLGAAARTIHIPAYKRVPELEVVGGYDPVVSNRGFGFPVFPSVIEMLEKTRPDMVAVVTPPSTHFELAKIALEAGCHVFCEKPFMPTLDEAKAVIALSKKVGRRVVINNQYRFMKIHEEAKKQIHTPQFGELLFVSANQTFFMDERTEAGWRGRDSQRTCKEFGTHIIDLCRFFFEEDPIAISARMPKGKNSEGPDYLNLIQLEFSGDRMAHITLDRLCRGRHRYLEIRMDGSIGCIETRLGGSAEIRAGFGGNKKRPFFHLDFSMGGRADLFHSEKFRRIGSNPIDVFATATSRLIQAFLDALRTDTVPPCDAAENIRTLALMLAAYQSDRERRTISMDYPVYR